MKFLKKVLSALGPKTVEPKLPETQPKEDWATFKRYKNDDYWLVLVNRGLLQNNQLVSMSWVSIEYRFLQRQLVNGKFPTPDTFEQCNVFEDQLSGALAGIGGEMAAAKTGFGTRMVWFCAPNLALEGMLRSGAQLFAGFPIDVSPASLKQYENMLPTHLENQLAGNERILRALVEQGMMEANHEMLCIGCSIQIRKHLRNFPLGLKLRDTSFRN
jgi:hypothetical protein